MFESDYAWETTEVYCDAHNCTNFVMIMTTCWADVSEEIKDKGWRVTRQKSRWHHICPPCKEGK